MSRERSSLGQLIIGGTILFVGLLWTLDSLDIAETGDLVRWWPVGLVILGSLKLLGVGMQRSLAGGLILTGLGTALTLDATDAITVSMRLFWPVVILLIGATLVVRALGWMGGAMGNPVGAGSTAFMAGVVHRQTAELFPGGTATAVMGGVDYDLSAARAVAPDASLDVFAFWGGIDLVVPPGWRLDNRVSAILGGVEDARTPAPVDPSGPVLTLRGLVVMGGLEIKNTKRD